MNVREALLQRRLDIDHTGDRYERRVSVAGADFAILSLKQGDVLSISDLEGCQSGEVYAVSDDGTPLRLFATPMGQRLADLLEQMGSKAAAVQHEIAARNLDPTKLTSEKILAGENPAGTSVSVKIPHDALVIVHAVGDTMFPHNQNPPTALQIQIEGYRTSPRAGANEVWKDLPEPLSKPKREIRIRAATASAYTVSKGDYIQIIDVAGRQCSDFIAFDSAALAAGRNWRSMRPRPEH